MSNFKITVTEASFLQELLSRLQVQPLQPDAQTTLDTILGLNNKLTAFLEVFAPKTEEQPSVVSEDLAALSA